MLIMEKTTTSQRAVKRYVDGQSYQDERNAILAFCTRKSTGRALTLVEQVRKLPHSTMDSGEVSQ
jgi:hypothetical protein